MQTQLRSDFMLCQPQALFRALKLFVPIELRITQIRIENRRAIQQVFKRPNCRTDLWWAKASEPSPARNVTLSARIPACNTASFSYWEAGAALYTDALLSYDGLASDYAHQVIDHAVKYVDGNVHTDGLENFSSLLKRTIAGTYVSVEPFHLFRYLDEQAYRFNNRKMTDAERFDIAVKGIVGKRLTFAEVTGKVGVFQPC